jgi:hypothetical protein
MPYDSEKDYNKLPPNTKTRALYWSLQLLNQVKLETKIFCFGPPSVISLITNKQNIYAFKKFSPTLTL